MGGEGVCVGRRSVGELDEECPRSVRGKENGTEIRRRFFSLEKKR